MATSVWGFPSNKASGDTLTPAEVNTLGNGAELALVQLAELLGAGVFAAADFNLSAGAGLDVDVSAGSAIAGDADSKAVVQVTSTTNVSGLTGSTTNYVFLQSDGTFTSNTTGTAPANALLVGSCVCGVSTVSSVNSAPTGRVNLTRPAYLSVAQTISAALTLSALLTLSDVNVALGTATGTKIGTSTSQKLGLWGQTPIARPAALTQTYAAADGTLGAYTPDSESVAYTGAADGEAKLADLNALRVGYENLRAFVEDLAQFVNQIVDNDQLLGLRG